MNEGGNGNKSSRGRRRPVANSPKYIVNPTPANQSIYNRYRTRFEDAKFQPFFSESPDSTRLLPPIPSDGGSFFGDDARSTSDISDGDELVNSTQPSPEASFSVAGGPSIVEKRRTRGKRKKPLSSKAAFEAAVVRKLNLACATHRRRKVKCTCHDLSLFERAWEHSRAPRATLQPELAPKELCEPPSVETLLVTSRQNDLFPGPPPPDIHIVEPEPEGIDLGIDAVPRESTTTFLHQFDATTLPSRPIMPPAGSDDIVPLWDSGSWTGSSLQGSDGELVAIEHLDRHGYWWVCRFCNTSVDTISMARDHYQESHLQRLWNIERTYRLKCATCSTTLEVCNFSLEPPRRFCLATLEQCHKWQLVAHVNTTTYSATGSEAITGVESGFSSYLPSSISSFPPLFPDTDAGSRSQPYHDPDTYTGEYTWYRRALHSSEGCAPVIVVRIGSKNDATQRLLVPKCFRPNLLNSDYQFKRTEGMRLNHHHPVDPSQLATFAFTTISDFARPVCKILAGMAESILSLAITMIVIVGAIVKLPRPRLVRTRRLQTSPTA